MQDEERNRIPLGIHCFWVQLALPASLTVFPASFLPRAPTHSARRSLSCVCNCDLLLGDRGSQLFLQRLSGVRYPGCICPVSNPGPGHADFHQTPEWHNGARLLLRLWLMDSSGSCRELTRSAGPNPRMNETLLHNRIPRRNMYS